MVAPEGERARDACEIRSCRGQLKAGLFENLLDLRCLSDPDFHYGCAVAPKQRRQLGRDDAVGVQSVAAAIERKKRIVVSYFRRKPCDLIGRDIGRVRHHEIERRRKSAAEIRLLKLCARRKAEPLRIGLGGLDRVRGNIGADTCRTL